MKTVSDNHIRRRFDGSVDTGLAIDKARLCRGRAVQGMLGRLGKAFTGFLALDRQHPARPPHALACYSFDAAMKNGAPWRDVVTWRKAGMHPARH